MYTVGIICEYNPLHNGHIRQFEMIRREFGSDTRIVCLMSGNYVQRGAPAVFDKSARAKAAVLCGANLVLELPITGALSSAEGFAAAGVRILAECCDCLCFGTESLSDTDAFHIAQALLSPAFSVHLQSALSTGLSFPAARQLALEKSGISVEGLGSPNNILAVEYCKAILSQEQTLSVFAVPRNSDYHAAALDPAAPSATAIRANIAAGLPWHDAIPLNAVPVFENAPVHTLYAGERAVLARLRTMTDAEFQSLPFGSEGLWRKLMRNARTFSTVEQIAAQTKSRRYTRTRIDRMILCAFLGISQTDLQIPVPYVRILAFNTAGKDILHNHHGSLSFINAGLHMEHPYWELEKRSGDLYSLFCTDSPLPPGCETARRIIYLNDLNGDNHENES